MKNSIWFKIEFLLSENMNMMLNKIINTKEISLENLPSGIIIFKSWWKKEKKFIISKIKNILLNEFFLFNKKKMIRDNTEIIKIKKRIIWKNI